MLRLTLTDALTLTQPGKRLRIRARIRGCVNAGCVGGEKRRCRNPWRTGPADQSCQSRARGTVAAHGRHESWQKVCTTRTHVNTFSADSLRRLLPCGFPCGDPRTHGLRTPAWCAVLVHRLGDVSGTGFSLRSSRSGADGLLPRKPLALHTPLETPCTSHAAGRRLGRSKAPSRPSF